MKNKTTSHSKKKPNKPAGVMTPYLEEQIVGYFLSNKNNTLQVMSDKFGVSIYLVGKAIDNYYSKI